MALLYVVESITNDDGTFEAVVRRDDGKIDKRVRYSNGDQAAFLAHVKKIFTPTLLIEGPDAKTTVETNK
jgi:hypothetical protein